MHSREEKKGFNAFFQEGFMVTRTKSIETEDEPNAWCKQDRVNNGEGQ